MHDAPPTEAVPFRVGYALQESPDLTAPRQQLTHISRGMILEICIRLSLRVPGNIIEFGVADGSSTRVIRRALHRYGRRWFIPHPRKRIFALDSFEGLRENFENAAVGTFAGEVPRVPGVTFVKGYFEQTCTQELATEVGRVAFAHLDADLYSSTKVALAWLTPLLGPGSLLLFDEFTGSREAEFRAFDEWRRNSGLHLARLAEFDRDPSGFGTIRDRRLLYQAFGSEHQPTTPARETLAWKIDYYLGRLGLRELQSRFAERF